MVRRNLLALLQLCLWLALAGTGHAKQQERQLEQTTRLGAGRFVKKNDSKDTPAPTPMPSVGPTILVATTDPPSVAPVTPRPAAATTTNSAEEDLDLSSSLFTDSSSTTPAPTPPAELLALVLNGWVDPTVLAMALRTYAKNNVVQIQDTRQVEDGTMYLYEISVHDTDPWLNEQIALAAFIRYAFDDSGVVGEEEDSTPLFMVQITRLEDYDDASATSEQEAAAQQEDDDDKLLLIVIMVVCWSLVCCCLGIAILLIPNLLRYRQELREQWSYNASKERQVTGAIHGGPSHTFDDMSEEEEEEACWGQRQLRHSMS